MLNWQGWQHERVVGWDGRQGRILLLLPSDPATHLKKVLLRHQYIIFRSSVPYCVSVVMHYISWEVTSRVSLSAL